jgi:hypothetical protein
MRWLLPTILLAPACGRFGFSAGKLDATSNADVVEIVAIVDAPPDSAVEAIPDLVVRYPMDADATATMTLVSTVPALDGTCTAGQCPAAIAGHIGGAAMFDGVDDFVILPTTTLISSMPYTISVWMNATTGMGDDSLVAKALGEAVNYDVGNLGIQQGGTGDLLYETSDNAGSYDILYSVGGDTRNAWHHVAASWDGTTKRLYLDGIVVGLAISTVGDSTELVQVGADRDFGITVHQYAGALDDLRFYSRALTQPEVALLAAQ